MRVTDLPSTLPRCRPRPRLHRRRSGRARSRPGRRSDDLVRLRVDHGDPVRLDRERGRFAAEQERHGHGSADEDREQRRPRSRAGVLRCSASTAGGERCRSGECGILVEHLPFECLQLGAGLDPEALDERLAGGAVRGERVGLPPRPVEREHLLRAEALAVRVLHHERVQLVDQVGVASERQIRVDPILERSQALLLELGPGGGAERRSVELGQRRAAPERERLVQCVGGSSRLGRVARLCAERRERLQVERARLERRARTPAHCVRSDAPSSPSALRSPATYTCSAERAVSGGASPQSSSISRSVGTTRFASSRSSASTARCLRGPSSSGIPPRSASSGPSSRKRRSLISGSSLASFWPEFSTSADVGAVHPTGGRGK